MILGIQAIGIRAVKAVNALIGADVIRSFNGIFPHHFEKTRGTISIANRDDCFAVALARNQSKILVAQHESAIAIAIAHDLIEHGVNVGNLHAGKHHATESAVRLVNSAREGPARLLVELSNERMHDQQAKLRVIAQLLEIVAVGHIHWNDGGSLAVDDVALFVGRPDQIRMR